MGPYTFIHKVTCESTMDEVFSWLNDHLTGSCLIMADRQTKGRGRRGRSWETLEGNLSFSLGFWIAAHIEDFSVLSFVAALAAGDTLRTLCPGVNIGYKWPNDILIQGKKIAGILIETHEKTETRAIVMGFGVNLKQAPPLNNYPTTSICDESELIIPPMTFLKAFIPLFDRYKDLWLKEGFLEISRAWHKSALYVGKTIHILTAQGPLAGVFQGMDHRGHLKLEISPQDLRTFSAADIMQQR